MELWAAFLIGLVGSLHCMGMCGPIALTITKSDYGFAKNFSRSIFYNLGRVTTYTLFGLIAGGVGLIFNLAGLQQYLSIAFGILLLIGVLFAFNFDRLFQIPLLSDLLEKVRTKLSRLINAPKNSTVFGIGLLNGFLPCGLVYLGISGAITTGGFWEGSLFMAVFGLGTVPAIAITNALGYVMGIKFRNLVKKAAPTLLLIVAILFIIRGLDLDIPYLSPKLSDFEKAGTVSCH